jgi:hypothetical protein
MPRWTSTDSSTTKYSPSTTTLVTSSTPDDDVPHPCDHNPVPPHLTAAVQAGLLSAEQAQPPSHSHSTHVCDQVSPDYDNLSAVQAVPPPDHQASTDVN